MNHTKRVLATLALAGAALSMPGTAHAQAPATVADNSTLAAPADEYDDLIDLVGGLGLLGGAGTVGDGLSGGGLLGGSGVGGSGGGGLLGG
ncbi:hypothetical protein [Streptomyces sp. NPDC088757]|uniref:hypothetical protein n=1 Tax=Streptomyces sp. NPDC088757 TaxID=3365889 RepID=UPI0037F5FEE5